MLNTSTSQPVHHLKGCNSIRKEQPVIDAQSSIRSTSQPRRGFESPAKRRRDSALYGTRVSAPLRRRHTLSPPFNWRASLLSRQPAHQTTSRLCHHIHFSRLPTSLVTSRRLISCRPLHVTSLSYLFLTSQ